MRAVVPQWTQWPQWTMDGHGRVGTVLRSRQRILSDQRNGWACYAGGWRRLLVGVCELSQAVLSSVRTVDCALCSLLLTLFLVFCLPLSQYLSVSLLRFYFHHFLLFCFLSFRFSLTVPSSHSHSLSLFLKCTLIFTHCSQ